jgi:hypothetical protein
VLEDTINMQEVRLDFFRHAYDVIQCCADKHYILMGSLLVMLVYIERVDLEIWHYEKDPFWALFTGALILAAKVRSLHSSWRIPSILIAFVVVHR